MSFRRQVAMFLNQPDLDVSFRVSYEGKTYIVYASTGSLKCFDCGYVGHKRSACPHKAGSSGVSLPTNSTVDLVVNESNGEQTTPNVSTAVDSENRSESNGEQTTPNVAIIKCWKYNPHKRCCSPGWSVCVCACAARSKTDKQITLWASDASKRSNTHKTCKNGWLGDYSLKHSLCLKVNENSW